MMHAVCIDKATGLLRGSHSIPHSGTPFPVDLIGEAVKDYGGAREDYALREEDDAGLAALIAVRDASALTMEQARERKTAEIRDAAEAFLEPYGREYGPTERQTWETQETEARALLAGEITEAEAVTIQRLVSARAAVGGVVRTVAEQAQRIVDNADAWRGLADVVTGQRNGYQDQVDAAQTVAEVLAVVPTFSFPGRTA